MGEGVKQSAGKRRYHSPRRVEQAAATRGAVLDAAREMFIANGYTATTVAEIAGRARVSVDTVYATRIGSTPKARAKISSYGRAIPEIQQQMAPIFLALRDASTTDRDCAALWSETAQRRARNMLLFAVELRGTAELREDLSDLQVADIIWSMNAAEYWVLLVHERSWSPDQFADWLIDAWTRLLLAEAVPDWGDVEGAPVLAGGRCGWVVIIRAP